MRDVKIGRRLAILLVAALGSWGATAAQAGAAALGPWRVVASSGLQNISEVGLARTADGVLHAAWTSRQTSTTETTYAVPISANGAVGIPQTVMSGWASTEDPALGLTPSGYLQAFFGGIHSLVPNDPNSDANLATSSDGGTTWSVTPGDVVAPGASAYGSPFAVSNSFAAQANPFETWYGTSGVWVHAGTSSATPNFNFQDGLGGCCGYYSNIATDGSGNTELAWYSNASGAFGVWAQAVGADGSPSGSPIQMPGTSNMSVGELQRTPLVARQQGGFYVAYATGYPSFTAVSLWKVGGGVIKVGGSLTGANLSSAGAAVDQAGRVWVFWARSNGASAQLFATRSNPSVTRFGAVVPVGSPSGTGSTYAIDGNASNGALDVFATLNKSGQNAVSIWTRHVYPGLTVALSPAVAKLHRAVKVTARVTDAGVPVKGASVKLGGHTGKTNALGKVVIRLKVGGTLTASASRAGYVSGSAKLHAIR